MCANFVTVIPTDAKIWPVNFEKFYDPLIHFFESDAVNFYHHELLLLPTPFSLETEELS